MFTVFIIYYCIYYIHVYTCTPGRTRVYRTPRSWHRSVNVALPKRKEEEKKVALFCKVYYPRINIFAERLTFNIHSVRIQ
jgi:hypothetical protein